MKSLSLSRPLILMVVGVPGSGKSFFARNFSDTFNTPLVSHDYIRSRMFDTPSYSKQEDTIVFSIADQQISELLKTEKSFIIDGGLNDKIGREALSKVAQKSGYNVLVVWVQTDEKASKKRSIRRSPKREGDTFNSSITTDLFDILSKQLVPPGGQETFIVISGRHTFATQAKVVLKKLISDRDAQTQRGAPKAPPTHGKTSSPSSHRNIAIN